VTGIGKLAAAVGASITVGSTRSREVKRHSYATPEAAITFFCDAKAQGYSPALIRVGEGWIVTVWA
jgi:hypothetical protein